MRIIFYDGGYMVNFKNKAQEKAFIYLFKKWDTQENTAAHLKFWNMMDNTTDRDKRLEMRREFGRFQDLSKRFEELENLKYYENQLKGIYAKIITKNRPQKFSYKFVIELRKLKKKERNVQATKILNSYMECLSNIMGLLKEKKTVETASDILEKWNNILLMHKNMKEVDKTYNDLKCVFFSNSDKTEYNSNWFCGRIKNSAYYKAITYLNSKGYFNKKRAFKAGRKRNFYRAKLLPFIDYYFRIPHQKESRIKHYQTYEDLLKDKWVDDVSRGYDNYKENPRHRPDKKIEKYEDFDEYKESKKKEYMEFRRFVLDIFETDYLRDLIDDESDVYGSVSKILVILCNTSAKNAYKIEEQNKSLWNYLRNLKDVNSTTVEELMKRTKWKDYVKKYNGDKKHYFLVDEEEYKKRIFLATVGFILDNHYRKFIEKIDSSRRMDELASDSFYGAFIRNPKNNPKFLT